MSLDAALTTNIALDLAASVPILLLTRWAILTRRAPRVGGASG